MLAEMFPLARRRPRVNGMSRLLRAFRVGGASSRLVIRLYLSMARCCRLGDARERGSESTPRACREGRDPFRAS
jgi:hypothetical protein